MAHWSIWLTIMILSVILFILTSISIKRQYRYATLIFDLLPFYPLFGIVSFVAFVISSAFWWGSTYFLIPIFVGGITLIWLFYKTIPWIQQYRLKHYRKFVDLISNDQYEVQVLSKAYDIKNIKSDKINIFIQHDVDLSLRRLKRILQIEKAKGIRSTSLFRLHSEKYSFAKAKPLIQELAAQGFEIGYHYEVLAQTEGDKEKGKELFAQELEEFRKIVPITVVEAHGDKYINRNVWPLIDKEKLGIYSAYEIKYTKYLSDAGGVDFRKRYGKHLFKELEEAKKGDIYVLLIHADWWFS